MDEQPTLTDPQTQALIALLQSTFSQIANSAMVKTWLIALGAVIPALILTIQAARSAIPPQWAGVTDTAVVILGIVVAALARWESITQATLLHNVVITRLEQQGRLETAAMAVAAAKSAQDHDVHTMQRGLRN